MDRSGQATKPGFEPVEDGLIHPAGAWRRAGRRSALAGFLLNWNQRNPVIGHLGGEAPGEHILLRGRLSRLVAEVLRLKIGLSPVDGAAGESFGEPFDAPREVGHFVAEKEHFFDRLPFDGAHERRREEEGFWPAPATAERGACRGLPTGGTYARMRRQDVWRRRWRVSTCGRRTYR